MVSVGGMGILFQSLLSKESTIRRFLTVFDTRTLSKLQQHDRLFPPVIVPLFNRIGFFTLFLHFTNLFVIKGSRIRGH